MDRENLMLDSEVLRDYRRKESKARNILLGVVAVLFFIIGISITLAITMPASRLETAGQHIKDYNMELDAHKKALAAVDSLYAQSCKSQFNSDFLAIFPVTKITKVVQKPKTVVTTEVAKVPAKTQQTTAPKPASGNNTKSSTKTTTSSTKPAQTTSKTTTTNKAPQTATAKTEKTVPTGLFADAVPIPAMIVRPADANYGIPENWPISSPVSVPYGYRPERGRFHAGVDLDAEVGVPVEAAGAGKVIRAEWFAGYGMCVDIEHANGYVTRYGHLSEIFVKKDQWVEVCEWIGANGNTGNSSAPHVHFEVHVNGNTIDPESINWTIRKMPPKAY
ncbi:MAG: M23 family metallopeptidase [Caldisericia bacterium]|nr:M23 family metallopeptidase [Caldisericia bacterium]